MNEALLRALAENRGVDVPPFACAAGHSEATVYRAISRGEIKATKIGKRVTIPPHEVRRLLHLDAKQAA